MKLLNRKSYYFDLPQNLIAQHPLLERDKCKLLLLNKKTGEIAHNIFYQLEDFLEKGDVLVLNTSKVIPARIYGKKESGAKIEVLLINNLEGNLWEVMLKPSKRLKLGDKIIFSDFFFAKLININSSGTRNIEFFSLKNDFWTNLENFGEVPLPPYIKRKVCKEDIVDYQTVFADEKGSVAAPTAGLHFTKEILDKLQKKGVIICNILLHVGAGTFLPVKTDNILEHKMHKEFCKINKQIANLLNESKKKGCKIIAVGTTVARALESFADENGNLSDGEKWTDIFLYPGKNFKIINGLLTNFHLPQSTLLMLVCAMAGYENTMKAYEMAIKNNYRFFSYGDAMLIL